MAVFIHYPTKPGLVITELRETPTDIEHIEIVCKGPEGKEAQIVRMKGGVLLGRTFLDKRGTRTPRVNDIIHLRTKDLKLLPPEIKAHIGSYWGVNEEETTKKHQ